MPDGKGPVPRYMLQETKASPRRPVSEVLHEALGAHYEVRERELPEAGGDLLISIYERETLVLRLEFVVPL